MASKTPTSVSLDDELKVRAQEIFESLGIDNLSAAFNIFLSKCVECNGLPFEMANAYCETEKHWQSMYELLKQYMDENQGEMPPPHAIFESVKLGEWLRKQRVANQENQLPKSRKKRLTALSALSPRQVDASCSPYDALENPEDTPVWIGEFECSSWTSAFLNAYGKHHQKSISAMSIKEKLAILDAAFAFISEKFTSDTQYAIQIMQGINDGLFYTIATQHSQFFLPEGFNPIDKQLTAGSIASYVWSPYTSSILNIISEFCNIPQEEITILSLEIVDWAIGYLSTVIYARAKQGLRNGRSEVATMDLDYHAACAYEEIAGIAAKYQIMSNWGFPAFDEHFPAFNKGESYCKAT